MPACMSAASLTLTSRDNLHCRLTQKCRLPTAPDSNADPEETHTRACRFKYHFLGKPVLAGWTLNVLSSANWKSSMTYTGVRLLLVHQKSLVLGPSTVRWTSPLVLSTADMHTDWVKVLHLTQHNIGHFKDVLPRQSLGLVLKKLNLTQQKTQ